MMTSCAGSQPDAARPTETPRALSVLPATDLIALDSANGNAGALVSTLHGRVALVSLWATWCEACVGELDALNRLESFAQSNGAMVVGVAVGEKRADVAAFLAPRALHYAQLVDEEFKLADALGQRQVPATLVIDRQGRVLYTGGALDSRALAAFRAALRDPG